MRARLAGLSLAGAAAYGYYFVHHKRSNIQYDGWEQTAVGPERDHGTAWPLCFEPRNPYRPACFSFPR
jgi:hypothetical protein